MTPILHVPSTEPLSTSAYDARDGFTINHLKVELNSINHELDLVKSMLRDERKGWTSRSYLYESEIIGLRNEIARLRDELVPNEHARDGIADDEEF
jgi:hypothetical protein